MNKYHSSLEAPIEKQNHCPNKLANCALFKCASSNMKAVIDDKKMSCRQEWWKIHKIFCPISFLKRLMPLLFSGRRSRASKCPHSEGWLATSSVTVLSRKTLVMNEGRMHFRIYDFGAMFLLRRICWTATSAFFKRRHDMGRCLNVQLSSAFRFMFWVNYIF